MFTAQYSWTEVAVFRKHSLACGNTACTVLEVHAVHSEEIRYILAGLTVDVLCIQPKGQWRNMGKCCPKHARFIAHDFEFIFLLWIHFSSLYIPKPFTVARCYVTSTISLRTVSYRTGSYKAAPLRLLGITKEGVKTMEEPKNRNMGGGNAVSLVQHSHC